MGEGRPDLLAVDDQVSSSSRALSADGGEVGAGTGLRNSPGTIRSHRAPSVAGVAASALACRSAGRWAPSGFAVECRARRCARARVPIANRISWRGRTAPPYSTGHDKPSQLPAPSRRSHSRRSSQLSSSSGPLRWFCPAEVAGEVVGQPIPHLVAEVAVCRGERQSSAEFGHPHLFTCMHAGWHPDRIYSTNN